MWLRAVLLVAAVELSVQTCEMYKKTVTYFMTERVLYRYIMCTNISPNEDLHAEIVSKMNSTSQYIEISNSSIPEISRDTFQMINLTELKMRESHVEIIQDEAFEGCNISTIILDDNDIRKVKARSFNSSIIYVLSLKNNSLQGIVNNNFVGMIGLRKLNLQDNDIMNIQENSFYDLISLEELNLSFNSLREVPANLLKRLSRLTTIYLNHNYLTVLDTLLFTQCKVLQYLNIQDNLLTKLDAAYYPKSLLFINASGNYLSVFNLSNLVNLDTIVLNRNDLKKTKDCLNNLPSLQYLYLSYNSLGPSLNDDTFQHLKNLSIIELDGNNLHEFDFGVFNNLSLLRGVSIAENSLTSLDFSGVTSPLKHLNLTHNSLREVKNLTTLKELVKLELSTNSFQEIKYNMFEKMINLKNLWLGYNSIDKLELGCFRDLNTLIELNLSHNKIKSVQPGVLTGLYQLIKLDISSNNLAYFDEDVFHSTKHLTFLNLAYNNLTNVNVKQMLSHLSWIREINLNGNNWTCIFLANIIRENKYLTLTRGTEFSVSNVLGIACNDIDDGIHFDKTQYLVDLTKLANYTSMYTKQMSYKMSVNNAIFIVLLILFCANFIYGKYSSYVAAARQFVYKKATSEQELQLI